MRRVLVGLLVLLIALLLAGADAARSQGGGFGDQDFGDLDSGGGGGEGAGEYGAWVTYAAERGSLGSADSPCQWQVHDYLSYQLWWQAYPGTAPDDDPPILEDDEGAGDLYARPWVIVWCAEAGSITYLDGFQGGDPPTDPSVLEQHARRSLTIPLPVPAFSPDPDTGAAQVVGLQTWVWLDEADTADQTATACIPSAGTPFACATITASFVDVAFEMGDDTPGFACGGPGVAYDPTVAFEDQADVGQCFHVYLDADAGGSTYPVVPTSVWSVSWSCVYDAGLDGSLDGSCGGGFLEIAGRDGAPVPLEVLDLQATAVTPG